VNPLVGFALAHAKQAPLDHLEAVCFEVGEQEEQSIFRRRERTVFVDREPAGGPRFPIEAPCREMGVVRGLEGRDQLLKLCKGQARQIQKLRRARLHIGEPDTGHLWCLLSWEAQYTIIGINSILYGKGGEFASNTREEQEVGMLALHLLQISLVYINTLMMQQVLAEPTWQGRLTLTDLRALTPLKWLHVNPYRTFTLHMHERLPLAYAA
jgi:Tn3 transposase DDE domain